MRARGSAPHQRSPPVAGPVAEDDVIVVVRGVGAAAGAEDVLVVQLAVGDKQLRRDGFVALGGGGGGGVEKEGMFPMLCSGCYGAGARGTAALPVQKETTSSVL